MGIYNDPAYEEDDRQGESFVWEHDQDTHGDWLNGFLCHWVESRDSYEVPMFCIDDIACWMHDSYIKNITDLDDIVINNAYYCNDSGFEHNIKAIDDYIKSLN